MRAEKKIDLVELEKLCRMQCTDEEIAAWFDISRQRFVTHHKKKPAVIEAMEMGRGKGRASLRHAQYAKAMSGNATMLIWCGKQILGQKDTLDVAHAGEVAFTDGARERVLSKLTSLITARNSDESDQLVN